MKLGVLALLPFALAFDLDEHPLVQYALADMEEHWSEFRSVVTQHLQPHHFPPRTFVHNDTDTCGACSQRGTQFIMEHAMKMMQGKCTKAAASSCVFGKVCNWMSKHPKVAMGLMFEHLRPMSLMQAYCTGKGSCDKPDPEGTMMAEILSGHQPHDALLKNFDQIDWTNVVEEATELVPQQPQVTELAKDATPKCETQSKVCPRCMMEATKMGTMRAVMKVRAMCHETKCPVMLKMCPWMKENKEVSLGMILSKVEPWKFAKGWCMHAQRSHEHGWHHHDDHEHGDHDWHRHPDHEHGDHDWHHHRGHWDKVATIGGPDWHRRHDGSDDHKHFEGPRDWHHGHEHVEGQHSPAFGFKGGIWSPQFWGAKDQKVKAEIVIQV